MKHAKLKTDILGNPIYNADQLIDLMYNGRVNDIVNLPLQHDYDTDQYLAVKDQLWLPEILLYNSIDVELGNFDAVNQNNWFMPDSYKQLNIKDGLFSKQLTSIEIDRVSEEYNLYESHNMLNLLKWLIYFVDHCRANSVVWGVGRGSSISSYILYLIGIHKINSIKYNLDYKEFFKD